MDKTLRESIDALKKYANGNKSDVDVETDKVAVLPKFSAKDVKEIRHKISLLDGTHVTKKY